MFMPVPMTITAATSNAINMTVVAGTATLSSNYDGYEQQNESGIAI